eukprot:scaffold151045_cov42-Prasinocladus_malaysianus.AAC.1
MNCLLCLEAWEVAQGWVWGSLHNDIAIHQSGSQVHVHRGRDSKAGSGRADLGRASSALSGELIGAMQ